MRNPPIVKCRFIPKGFCVNIFGSLWSRDTSWIDRATINHERIHTAQMRELLFIPFYILYGIEWLVRLIQYGNWFEAYKNISFEREAYSQGPNMIYLHNRKHYSWLHYLRKK